ncbi:MAG: O-antigen/teichoic acid export membrane protein [Bacteroidia bacterium]|jgi:O-antigen/teichoic acid export membrane protein
MIKQLIHTIQSEKGLVLLDQAVFSGNSFIMTALLARFLGIETFGTFSYLILGVYLLMSMSNALIIQPMQVAHSKFAINQDYKGFTLLLQLIVAILLLTISGIMSTSVFPNIKVLAGINLIHVGILYSAWLLHDFFRKSFLASQEMKNTIVVDCIMASIQLIGIIGLGVTHQLTLNAVIILLAASYTISSFTSLALSKLSYQNLNLDKGYLQYHKKEGSILFISSVLQWWSSNLFVVASGLFLGAAALGAFRLVQSMFGVLNLLLQTYENYVLPKAAKLYSNSKSEAKRYLRTITQKGAILFSAVLVPLFLFSKQAILLIGGDQYMAYHQVVRGMVILYAIIYAGYSVRIPIRILMLNNSFFIGYGISFIFSLFTFNYLLHHFNISGAIAGLIINQLLMISYWHFKLTKHNFTLWR